MVLLECLLAAMTMMTTITVFPLFLNTKKELCLKQKMLQKSWKNVEKPLELEFLLNKFQNIEKKIKEKLKKVKKLRK